MRIIKVIFIFIIFISCKDDQKLYHENTELVIQFNLNDYYNTKNGVFTRHYWNEIKTVKFNLSADEIKEIMSILKDNCFLELKSNLKSKTYQDFNRGIGRIEFSNPIIEKSVEARNDYPVVFFSDYGIKRFNTIMNDIEKIVYAHEEINRLPSSDRFIE